MFAYLSTMAMQSICLKIVLASLFSTFSEHLNLDFPKQIDDYLYEDRCIVRAINTETS